MLFELKIDSENAAFEYPDIEVARLLRQTADRVAGQDEGVLMDFNGNKVGDWFLEVPDNDD